MPAAVASNSRPSDQRRNALKSADNFVGIPSMVSNFFPIDRYFEASEKVLYSFERAFEARKLDDAYVLGWRFASFSMDALPKHNYYESKRYAQQRARNQQQLAGVIRKLEQVAEWMDREELIRQKEMQRRQEIERKRREMEQKKREQLLQQRIANFQKQQESVTVSSLGGSSTASSSNVQQSALDKLKNQQSALDKLNKMNKEPKEEVDKDDDEYMKDLRRSFRKSGRMSTSTGELSVGSGTATEQTSDEPTPEDMTNPSMDGASILPPPLPPPVSSPPAVLPPPSLPAPSFPPPPPQSKGDEALPPPPSYNSVVKQNGKPLPTYADRDREREQMHKRRMRTNQQLTAHQMRDKARADYHACLSNGRIEILSLDTYQGRISRSTNGCAVISPLVVSAHLRSRSAVSDAEVNNVIDNQCCPLLQEIRGNLDLGANAMIIPSDVHDHLIDKGFLSQDTFIDVIGGSILDRKQTATFIGLIDAGQGNSHKKLRTGGALFFKEHVVSVVKVPVGGGQFVFDLIDSLPVHMGRASRTRCRDLGAFQALLRYYAYSKFTESNLSYFDKNDWEEGMQDFDPRTFQGFVWGDPVKQ